MQRKLKPNTTTLSCFVDIGSRSAFQMQSVRAHFFIYPSFCLPSLRVHVCRCKRHEYQSTATILTARVKTTTTQTNTPQHIKSLSNIDINRKKKWIADGFRFGYRTNTVGNAIPTTKLVTCLLVYIEWAMYKARKRTIKSILMLSVLAIKFSDTLRKLQQPSGDCVRARHA